MEAIRLRIDRDAIHLFEERKHLRKLGLVRDHADPWQSPRR